MFRLGLMLAVALLLVSASRADAGYIWLGDGGYVWITGGSAPNQPLSPEEGQAAFDRIMDWA
ncbi:MAG TPA: hypothetical protein PKB11_12695, partial [Desulfovibrio sp.]